MILRIDTYSHKIINGGCWAGGGTGEGNPEKTKPKRRDGGGGTRAGGRGAAIYLGAAPVTPEAAVLESPAAPAVLSGRGCISGWKCDARHITVVLDENGEHLAVAMRQPRGDLRAAGGGGGTSHPGFIQQLNWALLGDGEHVVVAYDDGVEYQVGYIIPKRRDG